MPTVQLEHKDIHNNQRQFPLCVICDQLTSAVNVGMAFRISEAMGVSNLYLCGETPSSEHKKVQKTSRSTDKYVRHTYYLNTLDAIVELKKQGYTIVALEITNESQLLNDTNFNALEKIALIIGNEQHGVDHEVLKMCDLSVAIPMYGRNTSINVVNSLSIALYEITKQWY